LKRLLHFKQTEGKDNTTRLKPEKIKMWKYVILELWHNHYGIKI